jgi:hypothetical protein
MVSATSELNSGSLHTHFKDPLGLIPALHAIEYYHSKGSKPNKIILADKPFNPDLSIDLTRENPKWNVWFIVHNKYNLVASSALNMYNSILYEHPPSSFSNMLIKRANRAQLSLLSKKAVYEDKNLVILHDDDTMLDGLSNYPLNYKLRMG